jgi:hypothetical protein
MAMSIQMALAYDDYDRADADLDYDADSSRVQTVATPSLNLGCGGIARLNVGGITTRDYGGDFSKASQSPA